MQIKFLIRRSNSIEVLKKCCRHEIKQVMENFNKDKNRKDGVRPQCKNHQKDFYFKNLDKIKIHNEQNKERRNIYLKTKRETDGKFRLIANTRNRLLKSFEGYDKTILNSIYFRNRYSSLLKVY